MDAASAPVMRRDMAPRRGQLVIATRRSAPGAGFAPCMDNAALAVHAMMVLVVRVMMALAEMQVIVRRFVIKN